MRALRSANPEAVAKVEDRKISGPALLDKSVALLNEAMTASPERQVETRKKFDGIMREIDKIRLSNQN